MASNALVEDLSNAYCAGQHGVSRSQAIRGRDLAAPYGTRAIASGAPSRMLARNWNRECNAVRCELFSCSATCQLDSL